MVRNPWGKKDARQGGRKRLHWISRINYPNLPETNCTNGSTNRPQTLKTSNLLGWFEATFAPPWFWSRPTCVKAIAKGHCCNDCCNATLYLCKFVEASTTDVYCNSQLPLLCYVCNCLYLCKFVVAGTTSKTKKGFSVLSCLVHRHSTLQIVYSSIFELCESNNKEDKSWKCLRFSPRPAVSALVQCPPGYTLPPVTWK